MRKKCVGILLLLAALLCSSNVYSASISYTFDPMPADLYDLDHFDYVTWGIDWEDYTKPHDAVIESATLTFKNIRNYNETDNILYVHLLDSAAPGVALGYDRQGYGDAFEGMGPELFTWVNLSHLPETLTYSLTGDQLDILTEYLTDGNIGLGFDPDCHFYNDGVKLTIETSEPVPEPATLALMGIGILAFLGFRRKEKK